MKEKSRYIFQLNKPVRYFWSGKFVGKEKSWKHMERALLDFELIVMEKGMLYIEDEWQQYTVSEGEYLLMEPTRCQRGYRSSKCSFYWMHFSVDDQEKGAESEPEKRNVIIAKQGKLISDERLFILLKQLQDTELRYMDKDLNAYLATSILYELSHQQMLETKKSDETDKDLVEQVSEYVVEHFQENLHVRDIAAHFGYNEKYFSTAFRKKSGVSVKQFVDGKKMERAKYLLLNTNAWVVEIAASLGYENVQNFYHIFKKETNCTPTEYRNIYEKKKEYDV